jgi:hypothetical protein
MVDPPIAKTPLDAFAFRNRTAAVLLDISLIFLASFKSCNSYQSSSMQPFHGANE